MTNHRYFSFLWGITVGTAAGLLWAPRTGRRTRALLTRRARTAESLINERVTAIRSDVGEKILKRSRPMARLKRSEPANGYYWHRPKIESVTRVRCGPPRQTKETGIQVSARNGTAWSDPSSS
jgi:hypothetical protein